MALSYLVLDFETASACDLKKAGSWRYAEDPTTEVLCCNYQFQGNKVVDRWTPADTDKWTSLKAFAKDPEVTFIAHGAQFEKAIWRRIMVPDFGFPDVPDSRWHDTMAVCAMRGLPQELEHASSVLGLSSQKDTAGRAHTLGLSKPSKKTGMLDRSSQSLDRVYAYCDADVRAEMEMHDRLGWFPPGERKVWLLDQRVNERGVRLDMAFVEAAQRVVDKAVPPLAEEFRALTGVEVTQGEKTLAWLRGQGVKLPNLQKQTLADLLGDDEENGDDYNPDNGQPQRWDASLPEHVERALRIRQLIGSSSIKKLARMRECVGHDGRARGLLQYHGAGPGRWAGRLLQPQNFPRGTAGGSVEDRVNAILTGDASYVEATIGPAVECVVSSLRHALVPDPDCLFVAGDFKSIEARIVLALAGEHERAKNFGTAYVDMAELIFGRPIVKGVDTEEYVMGKSTVLGCGFQMGSATFQEKYAKKHPLEFCTKVVQTYRKDWAPSVPKVWYALEDAAARTVWGRTPNEAYGLVYQLEDRWLTVRLPSGRKLWYFNPQQVRKAMPWDPTDIRPGFTYQAMKMGQWKTIYTFGGHLTENVVQGMARDLLVEAMFKCEENNMPIALTVHDEILAEPKNWYADLVVLRQIMEDSPDWARAMKIPVEAEPWIGDRYKK